MNLIKVAFVIMLSFPLLSDLTIERTEIMKDEVKEVHFTYAPTMKFFLVKNSGKAVVKPPQVRFWFHNGQEQNDDAIYEDCTSKQVHLLVYQAVADERLPSDAFNNLVKGNHDECSGAGAGAGTETATTSDNGFQYTLVGGEFGIEPNNKIIKAESILKLELNKYLNTYSGGMSLFDASAWNSTNKENVTLSKTEEPFEEITAGQYPTSTIYFRSEVPDKYTISATPVGGAPVDSIVYNTTATVTVHESDVDTYSVKSVLTDGKDHFVCAKNTNDIVLMLDVKPNEEFIINKITWEAVGADVVFPAVDGDYRTVEIASDVSKKIVLKALIDGEEFWSGYVWVVWSNAELLSNKNNGEEFTVEINNTHTNIKAFRSYSFEITPQEIITDDDKPDFIKDPGDTISPVPDGNMRHIISDAFLSGGADSYWDASRQIRAKILNPRMYTKNEFPILPGKFFDGQPQASHVVVDYPKADNIGNDDTHTGDEHNNPYVANPQFTGSEVGKIVSHDTPNMSIFAQTGGLGDTLEYKLHYKEFLRLNIGDKWFRVSDFVEWKSDYKFKREHTIITTEFDMIVDTKAKGDDVQLIEVGVNTGEAFKPCINFGLNKRLDTVPETGDNAMAEKWINNNSVTAENNEGF